MTDTPTRDSIAKALSLFDEKPDTNGVVVKLGDLRALVAERDALRAIIASEHALCGALDFFSNSPRSDNPYADYANDEQREEWDKGWNAARTALSDQKGGG